VGTQQSKALTLGVEIIIWNSIFSTETQERYTNIDMLTGKMSVFFRSYNLYIQAYNNEAFKGKESLRDRLDDGE